MTLRCLYLEMARCFCHNHLRHFVRGCRKFCQRGSNSKGIFFVVVFFVCLFFFFFCCCCFCGFFLFLFCLLFFDVFFFFLFFFLWGGGGILFLVDEGREDPNTVIRGPLSVRRENKTKKCLSWTPL